MLIQLLYLFLTGIISFVLYPVWIKFVYRFHMGEEIRGDGPESHLKKKGTPTMGGVVFVFVVAVITILLNRSRTQTLFPVFIAALAGLLGLMEDFSKVYRNSNFPKIISRVLPSGEVFPISFVRGLWRGFTKFWDIFGSSEGFGLQSYQKIFIQLALGGFVAGWTYFRLGWDFIWMPLIGNVHIGVLYPIVILIFFILILNVVAFTDGIDGLAGGLGAIAFAACWVVASHLGYNSLATFSASFVGALLPFLYFNVHPARIFMGNVGSHVLGATLAVLAVVMHREVAFLFILGVFMLDGISSPLQQISVKLTRKRIFRMAPLHHHFELLGWEEAKVTTRFWLFGIFFALLGILIALF
jgi:phospho-N-acetylmuramoyl-pentapeptide-transferase